MCQNCPETSSAPGKRGFPGYPWSLDFAAEMHQPHPAKALRLARRILLGCGKTHLRKEFFLALRLGLINMRVRHVGSRTVQRWFAHG